MVKATLGGWHKVARGQIKKLTSAQARETGEEDGETARRTWLRLAVLLQKGNVALLADRIPTSPDLTTEEGIMM